MKAPIPPVDYGFGEVHEDPPRMHMSAPASVPREPHDPDAWRHRPEQAARLGGAMSGLRGFMEEHGMLDTATDYDVEVSEP